LRQVFPQLLADKTDEWEEWTTSHHGGLMAKTLALFFVLGLMVSCASHHHDRSISSVDKAEAEAGFRQQENRGGSYQR
jgi:hypothetical protein